MTKHIPVHKNMTGNHEQDAEEESSASEGERETVGKPTGKETVGKSTGKEAVGNLLEDTRHAECLGRYRNHNGKENNGRNSTKYMGTSPATPVTRET